MAKIDAGIGTITWSTDNLMLQHVMEGVGSKIVNLTPARFLQILNSPPLEDVFDALKKLTDKVSELEDKLEESESNEFDGEVIETGIGTIRYEIEGSIDQGELMELVAEGIQKHGVKGLLDRLREGGV